MFDSLKDKLSGFRDDVDEQVEEKVEEAEGVEEAEEVPDEQGDEDNADDNASFTDKAKTLVGERSFIIEDDDLEGPLQDLELALLSNDVEVSVANEILDNVRDNLVGEKRHWRDSKTNVVTDALKDALVDVLSVDGLDFDDFIA
ncbi:MAG: signal recognition particle receptor subunit alpha, partial [Halobacteria archaeon]|nr:signal recognition particle receptor subunit alpha [Halobacteria archaeon]